MNYRVLQLLFVMSVTAILPTVCEAASSRFFGRGSVTQRAQIRSMPLLHRPDRPGHVYGNTVRRLHRMSRVR